MSSSTSSAAGAEHAVADKQRRSAAATDVVDLSEDMDAEPTVAKETPAVSSSDSESMSTPEILSRAGESAATPPVAAVLDNAPHAAPADGRQGTDRASDIACVDDVDSASANAAVHIEKSSENKQVPTESAGVTERQESSPADDVAMPSSSRASPLHDVTASGSLKRTAQSPAKHGDDDVVPQKKPRHDALSDTVDRLRNRVGSKPEDEAENEEVSPGEEEEDEEGAEEVANQVVTLTYEVRTIIYCSTACYIVHWI